MKDLYSELVPVVAIGAASIDADNTPAAIDLQGYNGATVEIAVGVGGISFTTNNKIEFKLTHSDEADANYVAVTDDDVLGVDAVGAGGIIYALTAAHAAATVVAVGYIGNRRYLKLLADFGGSHASPTPLAANVIKGHGRLKPPVA